MRGPEVAPTAYVLLWFPKPSETFVFREVEGLRERGLPLHVFTLYGPWRRDLSPGMEGFAGPVERLGARALPRLLAAQAWGWRLQRAALLDLARTVAPRGHGLEAHLEGLWGWLCGPWLASRCRSLGITHIHAPWARGAATAAWVAAHLSGLPFSFTARSHDLFCPDAHLSEKARAARFIRTDVARYAAPLAGLAGGDEGKVRLVRSGIPLARRRVARLDWRAPYRLLAVGRTVPKKGFAVLLRACRLLAERGVDFVLTLAGGAPRTLRRQCRELELGDRVWLPGFVTHDQVARLYEEADVFVVPSVVAPNGDREGVPNVLVEALYHRLPVVASDVGGIAEVVTDGVTGRLVPPGDPVRLADTIQELLADRGEALRLATGGLERVEREYDAEDCLRQLLELFRA